jgi:hypothetical protein
MNTKALIIGLTLTLLLVAVPAFSQGKGVGPSVSSGAQARTGSSVRMQTPAANAGTKAHTNTQGKMSSPQNGKDKSTTDFASKIESNSKFAAKVQALLPDETTIQDAADGFKTQGLFIAALHVSQNLHIPFDDLKSHMTGPDAVSLGAAIKAIRQDMTETQIDMEVKKAEKQAKETEKN